MLFERDTPRGGVAGSRCEYDGLNPSEEAPEGKRPPCNAGLCCGMAYLESTEGDENRPQIETCQDPMTIKYVYKPKWDSVPVDWLFMCFDGAKAITVSAAVVTAALYAAI